MSASARALVGLLAAGLAVAGCASGGRPAPHHHTVTGRTAAPDSPSASPRGLRAAVLRLSDLPPGFIV
ncbi:MAG: hypothetical protein ACXVW7_18880, partial [Trebonia sp.]